jgi:hypothetical protein
MKILLFLIYLIPFCLFANPSEVEIQNRLDLLSYDKNFKLVSIKKIKVKKEYSILDVELESIHPLTKKNFKTEFFWYKPYGSQKRPLLTILPPVLDITPFDKIWAHQFATHHNYQVFILKYNEKIDDENRPLSEINMGLASAMTSARLMIDFAETRREIDSTKIATYGMSLGGILSSIFLSIEPRVDAGVLIVAGGNLGEILAKSDQSTVERYRNARMKAENIESEEELEARMKDLILFDPLLFASRRSPEDVYMVIAEDDLSVPTKNQIELWESFGRPEHLNFPGKHFPVIFKNLFQHKFIYNFLENRLGQE